MKVANVIIFIAFIGIAVFGYAGLIHGNSFSECAKSLLPQNMPCESNSMAMAISHVNIYHAFTLTVLTAAVLLLLGLLFSIPLPQLLLQPISIPLNNFTVSDQHFKKFDWLTILSKRDPSNS